MAQSIKYFGQLCGKDFFFSFATSGVRQFYLVSWLTEINGRIEEPCIKEMASASVRLVLSVIDISVLMEVFMPFIQVLQNSHFAVEAVYLPIWLQVSFGSLNQHRF